MRLVAVVGLSVALAASGINAAEIYLDELDLSNVTSGESVYWPQAKRGKDGADVEAYTELSRQEAAELVRRHPGACTDLWGNPLDVAVWPEGTLVYRMISR